MSFWIKKVVDNIKGDSLDNILLFHISSMLSHFVYENTYDNSIKKMAKYLSRMSYFVDHIEHQSCWGSFFDKPLNPPKKH